jgi:hypothetical protein
MSRFKRYFPALLLVLLAAASGFSFYMSIYVDRALTELVWRQQGYRPISWDQWFLLAICLICVFGASLAYAMTMAVPPDAWLETAFRTQIDRRAAVLAAAALAAALIWTVSHRSGDDYHTVKGTP